MRRLALALLAAALLSGCASSSIPRHAAVFSPTEPPTAPPTPTPDPASTPVATADASAWTIVAPDGEAFSVKMPGAAKSTTSTITTPGGDATNTVWAFNDDANRAFAVSVAKFKTGAFTGASAKSILDLATASIVGATAGATLASQSDVTVGGNTGRAITFGNSKTQIQCEVFIVGDSIVGASLAFPAGGTDGGVAAPFFASFQLTA